MKNLLFFLLSLGVASGFSQQDKTWALGVQWGFQGNRSVLSGGMETANARFQHNSFGGGALNLLARYDYNSRWMVSAGFGFNSFGYEFALSNNYSLKLKDKQYSTIRSEFGVLELPTLIYYKFKPNCKNSKWLVGAGFVRTLSGSQSISKILNYDTEGTSNGTYIRSEASSKGGFNTALRFSIAREKLFKRGNLLQTALLFNLGLKDISRASVTYKVDGQEYQHEFINRGSFVGFRLTYFFKPFNAVRS